jgi:type I restriction enzyme S subunit
MNTQTLLDSFETFADAPGGISRLRELLLDLAVHGRLTERLTADTQLSTTHVVPGVDLAIPESWGTVSFSEHFDMRGGGQPPKSTFKDSPRDGYIRLFQIRDYGPNPVPVYVPAQLAPRTSKPGDILIARYGASGKVFWAEDGAYNVALAKLIFPTDLYMAQFAFLLFKSSWFQSPIRSSTRVAVDGFNKRDLAHVFFPVPPVEEQEQIVAKVNELMALCDQLEAAKTERDSLRTAARKSAINAVSTVSTSDELSAAWSRIRENWTTYVDTPESISSLRSMILDLAVKGALTSDDNSKVQSSITWTCDELRLQEDKIWKVESMPPSAPTGWNRLPLARLGQWGSGGTPTATCKEFYRNGSIPWAVIGDLNDGVMTDTATKITDKALASSSAKLIPENAVLVAMYGASIGKAALSSIECSTNQAIAHCIADEGVVSPEYLFLIVRALKRHLVSAGRGAAQPNISQTVLKHLLVDVPGVRMQLMIVKNVNELLHFCDQIEEQLKACNDLVVRWAASVVHHTGDAA